jgi:glycosyltransferase involved in cell wall biosynthesis
MLKKRFHLESRVIYNGVNSNNFRPKDKRRSKKLLGYKERTFIILFIGKLSPYKDPLTLLNGFYKAMRMSDKNLRLVIIGKGELLKDIKNAIQRLDLSQHVTLHKYVSNERIRLHYSAADLFVLPSYNEAFGIVLLEAMASGLPVIASNTGACQEVLLDAGVTFNQGDSSDLARKIMKLSVDKNKLEILASKSLNRAKQFSWKDISQDYLNLYKSMLDLSK